MTFDSFLTMLQILIPSALFGVLMLGGASPSVARWLGRRRRPLRFGRRRSPVLPPAPRMGSLVPVHVSSAPTTGARLRGTQGSPDRRAA